MKNEADPTDPLEAALKQARTAGRPSDDLVARVLADAAAVQAEIVAAAKPPEASRASLGGRVQALIEMLGGWPAASGVALAGVAGLSLGFWAPDVLDVVSSGQLWYLTGDSSATPDLSSLWLEDGDV